MANVNQQQSSRFSWLRRWVTRKSPQLRPRAFPTSGFEIIDPSEPIEEECMSIYKPELFYPVCLGEVFQSRYQVVAKLGFGSSATIWLAHDLQDCTYVCLKVQINAILNNHEARVYEHLEKHRCFLGSLHIRPLERSFRIQGPHGSHHVLVQAPLAVAITDFQNKVPKGVFTSTVVKEAMKQMVPALDFLHSDAHVIHTDFHPGNLLIRFQDRDECLSQVEDAELKKPGPRKVLKDRTIYRSRVVIGNVGPLYLCDFGNAHIGDEGSGIAMSISFRAPEVILGMKWSYPIDMWSVGVSVWDMLQSKKLFKIYDVNDQKLNDAHHLAHMIALLGPPPLDYLKRSKTYLEFWDEHGDWRGVVPIPQEKTLESLEGSLQGDDRARYLEFTRALLCWAPETRLTAKQTLVHPWLTTPYE